MRHVAEPLKACGNIMSRAYNTAMSELAFEDVFRTRFISVGPKILDQWSTVDPVELAATKGELGVVVDLVVRATDRSPSEIEAKLRALSALSEPVQEPARSPDEAKSAERRFGLAAKQMDEVLHAVKRFEAFAADEARKMKSELAPIAEKKIRANLWTSLLVALGLGFVLGLWMRGGRRS